MTYELAKQLKDAGFPFKESREARPRIILPTLSELIAACGYGFQSLRHIDTACKNE